MDFTIPLIFHPYLVRDSEKRGESLYYMVGTKFREISRLITNTFWSLLNLCKKTNKYFFFLCLAKMVTTVALFSSFINTCAFDTTSWATFSEDQSAENLSGEVKIFHVSFDLLFDLPPPLFCTFECEFMFRARVVKYIPSSGCYHGFISFHGGKRSGGIFIAMWQFQPNASVNLNWG